jgi:hypothetical protein
VALGIELYQHFFILTLRAEKYLVAIGILPAGKVEAVRALEHLADVEIVSAGYDHLKARDSMQ